MSTHLRSVPIRLRLALAFAVLMALVLAATGAFVYIRTSNDLDQQIARELDARLAAAVAIVRDDGDDLGDPVQEPLSRIDPNGVVQVLDPAREVADATTESLRAEPLLPPDQITALSTDEVETVDVEGPDGPLRVTAARSQDDGVRYAVIAGASLEERNQALSSLSRLLLIGGPIALLLASLAAYWVATAALRPVDAIRRRAAVISERDPGQRLPSGPADDEISELAATLNGMLARLEAAIGRERRFVADASHELRTPLTILKAEVELALAEGRTPEQLRAALLSSGEEVDRLARLADDLLDLARADEGRLPLQAETVDVAALAARLANTFAGSAGGREILVTVEGDPVAEADPLRLEQALSNLIENALAHGSGPVEVRVSGSPRGVEVAVADHGGGFGAEIIDRATERFARGPDAGGSGTGLGLAIVEAVAAGHGGSVTVANREPAGAIVTFTLPAEPAAPRG
jgi:heavy metal sensor kinase